MQIPPSFAPFATSRHILWLCKWHRDQNHKPLPPEWMERITCQDEEPLWSKGWIPLEPQEHLRNHHPTSDTAYGKDSNQLGRINMLAGH